MLVARLVATLLSLFGLVRLVSSGSNFISTGGQAQQGQLPGTPLPNAPLHPFAISQPLLVPFPDPPKECTRTLITHSFAFSFGLPAIAPYSPPSEVDCGKTGSWARVVMTFTATSNGTQFDRLSSVYLQGVEIWRTSTPEPTTLGIQWTAQKDITRYKSLLSQYGTLVLDLANLLDATQGLNGIYDVSLSITYIPATPSHPSAKAADLVLPLSLRSNTSASVFVVPPSGVTLTHFPVNAAQAFVEIYASGDSLEEFWYGNVPDSFFSHLPPWNAPDGQANPHGPFREVQLLIDDFLAGVVFPYPVIYSGEFLPSIWRPMLSYGAFDSPTYYIDITPFIPSLSDGQAHNFTLTVVGQDQNLTINSDWILSGNVQVFLDHSNKATTGHIATYAVSPFIKPTVHGSITGTAPDVFVTTTASRRLLIEGELQTGSGTKVFSTWEQDLSFSNSEQYLTTPSNVSTQVNLSSLLFAQVTQMSTGCSRSFHNGSPLISDCFNYPLNLFLTYALAPSPVNVTFYDYTVHLNHSFVRDLDGGPSVSSISQSFDVNQICQGIQSRHQLNTTLRTGETSEVFHYSDSTATFTRQTKVATFANNTVDIPSESISSLIEDFSAGSLAT